MNWMSSLMQKLRLNKPPKPYFINDKYKVVPAFRLAGVDYFMFDNQLHGPTGRMMTALGLYEELNMRIDREYIEKHCAAMEKILSDPKKISVGSIAILNKNMKERLNLMPLQDQVLKYASVVFFDKNESVFEYDYDYNRKKIDLWKRTLGKKSDIAAFFLKTPLVDLIPSLGSPETDSETFLEIRERIDEIHRLLITDILSGKE